MHFHWTPRLALDDLIFFVSGEFGSRPFPLTRIARICLGTRLASRLFSRACVSLALLSLSKMGTTGSLTSSSYDNFFEFPSLLLTNDSTAYHKLFFASYQRNGVFFLLIFSPMHVNIIHVQLYRSFSVTWSAAFQIAWNKRSFNI